MVPTKEMAASAPTAVAIDYKSKLFAWIIIAITLAIDFAWCARVGLKIGHWHYVAAVTVTLLTLSALYSYRSVTASAWAEGAALLIAFTASGCVLTYLATTTGRPLQDAALISIDRAIGFDWLNWHQTVLIHPWLYWPLRLAYGSLPLQMMLAVFVLPMAGQSARVGELVVLGVMTLFFTVVISALFPVIGPFGMYGEGHEAWLSDFLALRSGGPWTFDLPAMQGIVAMPSYHTVLAVLLSFTFRRMGWIGWCILGLNALMLPSIPAIGWHYLSDMIAGGAIAAFCVAVVPRRMHRWASHDSLSVIRTISPLTSRGDQKRMIVEALRVNQ